LQMRIQLRDILPSLKKSFSKPVKRNLPKSTHFIQRSWQRLNAGLLHFRMSFSHHWMRRKKALVSLHCDNAGSQSSTCPMRSVSNIGILKTLSWPSASSTSASSCCRTI
ncbi:hypothetical protein A6R68_15783, partial [Neotoma lepida]